MTRQHPVDGGRSYPITYATAGPQPFGHQARSAGLSIRRRRVGCQFTLRPGWRTFRFGMPGASSRFNSLVAGTEKSDQQARMLA